MADWSALIPEAPFDWEMIPLDGQKRPIDPATGRLLRGWQSRPGYDIDGLMQLSDHVKAVGLKLGPASGGVLAVDFDGPEAPAKFVKIFQHQPGDLPSTIGVSSGKHCRGQRFFLVDQDWWTHLKGRRAWSGPNGSTCLELRWASHQSVIAGAHPETDGYTWLPNSSPAECTMAVAPPWLLAPLVQREDRLTAFTSSAKDANRAEAMLRHIDPQTQTDYCSWLKVGIALHHTDPGLLSAWVAWSEQMPNFDRGECLKKWESFGKTAPASPLTIRSLHHWAKAGGYQEADKTPSTRPETPSAIDQWDQVLQGLVDPSHPNFEKNCIRRQIRAGTAARELGLSASSHHVRASLIQQQRNLITGTETKGTRGGEKAQFKPKQFLINNLIAMRCLTGIAAFNKVGKTKLATELAACLIHQTPFMGNPEWMPAQGPHKLILWWVDQPGADSSTYLKARGLMEADGTLHPQIVALYTEEDDLAWDDQGMDRLIQDTSANPGAVLITDSFFACIQRVHGNDQEPEAGGALIDVQTLLCQSETTHICLFHSPKETGPVGINAIRGHGSAGGAVSGCVSLHYLERKDPQTGKWVADKDNAHRRMVFEGRGPYLDLLIRADWRNGTFSVLGPFQQKLGELTADRQKSNTIDKLTDGQRQTLEFLGAAMGIWKDPSGVTAQQVAACKVQHLARAPTASEVEITRKQLQALVKDQLAAKTTRSRVTKFSFKGLNTASQTAFGS